MTYTPVADFNGPDSFIYTVSDGNGGTATATVLITVTPVNDVPLAEDATVSTAEDTAVDISFPDTDVEGDAVSVVEVSQGGFGVHDDVLAHAAGQRVDRSAVGRRRHDRRRPR